MPQRRVHPLQGARCRRHTAVGVPPVVHTSRAAERAPRCRTCRASPCGAPRTYHLAARCELSRLQALLHSSHMYSEAKHSFASHGVLVDNLRVDVDKMMAQKTGAVGGLTKGIEGLFKKNKARGEQQ